MRQNYARNSFIAFGTILTAFLLLSVSPKHTSGDFDVYYLSSQHYLAKAPVYIARNGIEEYKYSPLFALVFSPLVMFSKTTALYIWSLINIFWLYFIFYIFYKLKQISFDNFKDFLLLIGLLALTGRFIFINIKLGQINILLCSLMVLTMYLEITNKDFWAAVALACSLMIKFFPVLFLVYFVLTRRFKVVGYTLMMVVFFLFLPSLYTGFGQNLAYLHDWHQLLKSSPSHLFCSVRNNSFLAFFTWLFIARHEHFYVFDYNLIKTPLSPQVYFCWGTSCLVFFTLFYYDIIGVKSQGIKIKFLDYSCLFACALLFNPLAYLNALVFLLVPYFFLLRYLLYSVIDDKNKVLMVLLLVLSLLLNVIDHSIFFKAPYLYYRALALKPLMWTIITVYLALAAAKNALRTTGAKSQ